tara:strand:- start:524 stop:736 length:213 start_codon:yes stop_codon:yes gene_type:complete
VGKFQYKIVNYHDFIKPESSSHELNIEESSESKKEAENSKMIENKLNELGKEGWELVEIINNKFFLKRAL